MTRNISEKSFESFHWLDIKGPTEAQLEDIAKKYNLEVFPVKDSLEHGHLPKIEKIKNYDFIILRAYTANEFDNNSTVEELSNKVAFFYNENQLITIHRTPFLFLEDIFKSDLKCKSVYELIIYIFKEIVKTYDAPSQWQTDQVDEVEKTIFLKKENKISLEDLYFQKAETRISKKLLVLTQNVINKIHVPDENLSALEDVKDNLVKLILAYEEAMEDAINLMNTFLSVTAQKNNDVVKLLTVFSAFFLPLTFLVGVYGMNFKFMPELEWKYGYLYAIIFMFVMCVFIYIWFKKKNIM
ncbi:CorA family divalent cation transporter [Flavobacterium sp. PL02]|uniref:CorA family divalent cation transporter n=1 Tax=Flavobacterium sp. PL02 TaxID=3088354 RepID=UPI002B23E537|nr:CorA family divalent cation transporter [Flavobacterium sp. PL02]MEA9413778.1 CorA family divalent cation transporter [Flavobacterium sp. PL02]